MEPAPGFDRRAALHALLDFYVEAGIDCALAEEPIDRFAEEQARRESLQREDAGGRGARNAPERGGPRSAPAIPEGLRQREERAPPPPTAPVVMAPEEAQALAHSLAAQAQSLTDLDAAFESFEGCALKGPAKNFVVARGDPRSRVMLLAHAPCSEDDREGAAFAGRDGELLEKILQAIGLSRESVHIACLSPWRPAGNRPLTPAEIAVCLPFARRRIQLSDPDFLVCLGEPAMQALFDVKEKLLAERGRWRDFDAGSRKIRAMATLHPDYVLKQPLQKRQIWRDMRVLKRALEGAE
jgi:uracil-DNA glycosylase